MTHADAENAATAESAGESGGTADGGRERRARTPGAAPRRRAEDHQAEALKREVFGIATLAVALCMFLALASFDPADLLPNGPAVDTGRTANLIGPVGASVADILLRIFGLAAFLLPLTLGVPGVFFLVGRRVEVKTIDAVGYPVLVLCGAMLAHLLMSGMLVFGHAAGGLIGSTGAEVLRSLFGATGAYIIIYAVLALTFVLTTRISLVSAARHIARPAENGDDEPSAPRGLRGLRRRAADRLTVWRVARAEKRRAQAEEKAAARAARAARVAKETTGAEDTDVPDATVKAQGRKAAKVGKRAPRETETANAEGSGAFSMGDKSSVVVSSEAFRLGETGAAGSGPRIVATRKSTEAFKAVPAPLHDAELADGDWSASDSAEVVATDDGRFAGSGEDDDEFLDDAELDDPLDRVALSGRTDTVLAQALPASNRFDRPAPSRPQPRSDRPAPAGAPRLQGSVPAAPGVSPIGPVVMPRKSGPRVEQLEIPLPPAGPIGAYDLPPLNLLDFNDPEQVEIPAEFLREQADRLIRALETYKIQGRVTEIHPGPVVTMFEFEPAPGVRISKIASLADDLAMAMKALKVRIVAPIPGKGVVGFEVPNQQRETVWLKEIIGDERFHSKKNILPIALGKGIDGTPEVADLAKMPHLLVAGTTGSGKSVGVNGMITSLLYHAGPDEVRFIMVDPKMLELSIYEGIPHLLLPVVTDPKKAAAALRWACDEMDRRYELMKNAGVRDIRGFNAKIEALVPGVAVESPEVSLEEMLAASDAEHDGAGGEPFDGVPVAARGWEQAFEDKPTKLPFIVVVIDEFADLMMVAGKEVEFCVARIAQKARAAGIHLILATQRPSVDVITGVIKANFPTRIAFQVSSAIDSRTILSCNGAENLLGKGDMLYMPPGTGRLTRVHGASSPRRKSTRSWSSSARRASRSTWTSPSCAPRKRATTRMGPTAAISTPCTTSACGSCAGTAARARATCSAASRSATTARPASSTRWRRTASWAPEMAPNRARSTSVSWPNSSPVGMATAPW
jgi:S-DNA-T family DNA segregation ATPase FtsK/SpoIIIE